MGIDITTAGEKGLRLLFVLAFGFPAHFMTDEVLTRLLTILTLDSLDPTVIHLQLFN